MFLSIFLDPGSFSCTKLQPRVEPLSMRIAPRKGFLRCRCETGLPISRRSTALGLNMIALTPEVYEEPSPIPPKMA